MVAPTRARPPFVVGIEVLSCPPAIVLIVGRDGVGLVAREAFAGSLRATKLFWGDLSMVHESIRLTLRTSRAVIKGSALVFVLACGIAALLFAHGLTQTVLFSPERVAGDGVVSVMVEHATAGYRFAPSVGAVDELLSSVQCCSHLTAFRTVHDVVRGEEGALAVEAMEVDANFFRVLERSPAVGRAFAADGLASDAEVTVVGASLARTMFGGSTEALGKEVFVGGKHLEIVGVLPPQFTIPFLGSVQPDILRLAQFEKDESVHALARLAPGMSRDDATKEIVHVGEAAGGIGGEEALRFTVLAADDVFESRVVIAARVLFALAIILAMVAVISAAQLSASRLVQRRSNFALRCALGLEASRARLAARYVYIIPVSVVAAGLGGVLAHLSLQLARRYAPSVLVPMASWSVSLQAIFGAALACAILLVLSESVPELIRSSTARSQHLRDHAYRHSSKRGDLYIGRLLIFATCGVASLLIVTTGITGGAIRDAVKRDWGFDARGVSVAKLWLPDWRGPSQAARRQIFEERVGQVLSSTPGVTAYAVASSMPPDSGIFLGEVRAASTELDHALGSVGSSRVSSDYFKAIGLKMISGRPFRTDEIDGRSPAIIVSESLARHFFTPAVSAVGEWLEFDGERREVVAVVADVTMKGASEALLEVHAYWPFGSYRSRNFFALRGSPSAIASAKQALHAVDQDLVVELSAMEQLVRKEIAETRLLTLVIRMTGLLSLVLGAGGVYSLISNLVHAKKREMAVRSSLGATPSRIWKWLAREVWPFATCGVVAGLIISYPFCRQLSQHLLGADPDGASARVVATAVVLTTAFAAMFFASYSAIRRSPFESLKVE